jgi:hypothetical protein
LLLSKENFRNDHHILSGSDPVARLLARALADDESGPVFEHLQTCPRCETLARELESSADDLMDHLRAAGRCGLEDSRPSWLSRVQAAVPDADGNGWRQPDAIGTKSHQCWGLTRCKR